MQHLCDGVRSACQGSPDPWQKPATTWKIGAPDGDLTIPVEQINGDGFRREALVTRQPEKPATY